MKYRGKFGEQKDMLQGNRLLPFPAIFPNNNEFLKDQTAG